ncbi:hypothetical protein [Frateuria soli]|uniref:hypothetical protein n=1 Tax=Frateuria soli TaxID=1542730 RepID=UPI001E297C91|nr:hypothetical protein [Frateuria soli]UGB38288.1 hypothetical protein LQ771_00060 [Frateuria soli]
MKPSTCLPALVLAAAFAAATPAMAMQTQTPMSAVPAAPRLDAAMRALWHGHVVHTRDYALAVHAHDSARARAAANAVVANARQIADAVAGFYGKPAGARMLELLAAHWGGVKALTDARVANDSAAERKAMAELQSNVGEIAKFLSGANPNLPENAVQGLMAAHVAHHATQIQQIMAGDMKHEQSTWEAMQAHMDMISDALAGAIARQFPDKAA